MNIKQQVVLITGSSSGIGWETALAFAAKGAKLAIAARTEEKLRKLEQILLQQGAECLVVPTDVTQPESVKAMAAKVIDYYKRVDILVNNAGFGIFDPVLEADMKGIESMMDVNYFGVVRCIQAVVPRMVQQKRGHVVNVASVAGFMAAPTHGGYSASKFAVIGMSEALREEVRPYGVKVTTINPGPIDTPFFERADMEQIPKVAQRFILKPDRVAHEIVRAVELEVEQVIVPKSMTPLVKLKALLPGLFAKGTSRFYK